MNTLKIIIAWVIIIGGLALAAWLSQRYDDGQRAKDQAHRDGLADADRCAREARAQRERSDVFTPLAAGKPRAPAGTTRRHRRAA